MGKRHIGLFSLLILLLCTSGRVMAQPQINVVLQNDTTIGKFQLIELTVDLTASYTNPYDYSQTNLKAIFFAPGGKKDTVDGFYCQDYIITDSTTGSIATNGNPAWKIRFTPTEVGNWHYQVYCTDNTGTSNFVTQNFTCISSALKGFIRKANNRYMKFDDNSQYFAIGSNYCWWNNNAIVDYRTWLDSLTAYGGNFIRIWMGSWSFALEWDDTGLGNYTNRQDRAFYLDWLLSYAEQKQVFIELCLNNHGQVSTTVNGQWESNPYNAANGGPCLNTWDFFTNQDAKQYYKNRIRYIVARWGYATNIFSWEKFNEVEWTDNFSQHASEVTQWTNEMAGYIKNLDVNKHLVSTSYAIDIYDPATWQLPVMDYTQTHYYVETPEIEKVLNSGTESYLNQFNKPTKNGEYGLFTTLNNLGEKDPDGIFVHNVTWSTAFSGAYGIGMSWWWDWYIHPYKIYRHFKALSEFISAIDLLSVPYSSKNFECQSELSAPFLFTPMYNEWAKSPSNDFTVTTNGILIPGANELGRFLFGNTWNTQYRNPPTFHVNYSHSGAFTVKTGPTTGESPTIEIWLDGILKLNNPASVNKTYSINIPAGSHAIKVDNKGTDWIEISEFTLDDYIPVIKSNALVNPTKAYGWVHNRNYNWKYVYENGIPDTVRNGKVRVAGLDDGIYTTEWINCQTGNVIETVSDSSMNGTMKIECPAFLWDCAYKISFYKTLDIYDTELSNILIYPNPTHSVLYFSGVKQGSHVEISDLTGRILLSGTVVNNQIDVSILTDGLYIIKMEDKNFIFTRKFLKLR